MHQEHVIKKKDAPPLEFLKRVPATDYSSESLQFRISMLNVQDTYTTRPFSPARLTSHGPITPQPAAPPDRLRALQ